MGLDGGTTPTLQMVDAGDHTHTNVYRRGFEPSVLQFSLGVFDAAAPEMMPGRASGLPAPGCEPPGFLSWWFFFFSAPISVLFWDARPLP